MSFFCSCRQPLGVHPQSTMSGSILSGGTAYPLHYIALLARAEH